ncbi:hypothetical protein BH09VER1_BH09VER1_20410 [soil metagenome]
MTTLLLAAEAIQVAPTLINIPSLTFGLAGGGAAIGIGLIGGRAAEAVGRNPGAFNRVLTMGIIFMALAEAMGIFGLVFLLINK